MKSHNRETPVDKPFGKFYSGSDDASSYVQYDDDYWLSGVNTDLSNIRLEGARIVRVIEDADQQRLSFEVSYPITDGGSDFPRRKFVFQICNRYLVDETGMPGEPVIQRVEVAEAGPHRKKIRMHTDHGVREVTCYPSVFEESL